MINFPKATKEHVKHMTYSSNFANLPAINVVAVILSNARIKNCCFQHLQNVLVKSLHASTQST
jgi:hypothetical protein